MSEPKDFFGNIQDVFLVLLRANQVLANYDWQEWDSDAEITLPRGYMNLTSDGELAGGQINRVQIEIILEGKPKRAKLATINLNIEKMVADPHLPDKLNQKSGGLIFVYGPAEEVHREQVIFGDIRRRSISFNLMVAAIAEEKIN